MKKAVIVGGGHNGLVCAFNLARAGMKVSVLERRGMVGGACVTEEFIPGAFDDCSVLVLIDLRLSQLDCFLQCGPALPEGAEGNGFVQTRIANHASNWYEW